jgi:hypothetical protein
MDDAEYDATLFRILHHIHQLLPDHLFVLIVSPQGRAVDSPVELRMFSNLSPDEQQPFFDAIQAELFSGRRIGPARLLQ